MILAMRKNLALVLAVTASSCGGSSGSLVEAYPGPAAQLSVAGVANAELFCELGEIGGIIGPVRSSPTEAAEAFALPKAWDYDSVAETGGTNDRRLLVFVAATGEPIAEVVVSRITEAGVTPTTAPPGFRDDSDRKAQDTDWQVMGVQACG